MEEQAGPIPAPSRRPSVVGNHTNVADAPARLGGVPTGQKRFHLTWLDELSDVIALNAVAPAQPGSKEEEHQPWNETHRPVRSARAPAGTSAGQPARAAANRAATFALETGVAVYGGFDGTEILLSQRDVAANPTILSGDTEGNDANTDGNGVAETSAGIVGSNAYHVVTGSGTDNNRATTSGGGIHHTSDSHPALLNALIANSASGGDCVNEAGGFLSAASSHNVIEDSANASGLVNGVNGNIVGLDVNVPTAVRAAPWSLVRRAAGSAPAGYTAPPSDGATAAP